MQDPHCGTIFILAMTQANHQHHKKPATSQTSALKKLSQILAASRPISWVNTAFPFAIAFLLSGGQLDQIFWAGLVYFLLPYNLLVYGVNDIYDYESDLKNPRKGSLEGSIVAPQARGALWAAIIATNLVSLAWLGSLVGQNGKIVLILTVILAVTYSLKGLRFKEIPVLDSINSSFHFVLPAVLGFVVSPQATIAWLPTIAFFLWGMASHALGAIQDIIPDRAANIRSIATQWGARRTIRFSFWLYVASATLTAIVYLPSSLMAGLLVAIYALNAAMFLKYSSDAQSKQFRRAWTNFMWLNGVVGFWLTQLILYLADPFNLGPGRIDYILTFCTLFSIAQILLIAHNFVVFRRPKTQRLDEWPRITIMTHAYNQAENISSTLLAALGQNYPDFEVLFTDLGSEDNTRKIAENFTDKRLRIITIDPIESGWGVDAWAADQLLKQATGEYTVLISADTVLLPNTLAQIAMLLEQEKLDVLSLLSADQNKSLAQKTILSHNQYLMLAAYPSGFLQEHAPERSTAHGSIIAFDSAKIRRLGGFEDVRASPLEDQELFHRARHKGLHAQLFRASDLATSQNHLGLRGIIDDNLQRFYPALRFHFPLTIFLVLAGTFVFSMPVIVLIYSLIIGTQVHLISIAIALGAAMLTRILIALEAKQDVLLQITAPITNIAIMIMLFASLIQYELHKPRWKNRTGIV
jgi:4-hydroxybenzoate polyprenyltransferase/glycosyltransferase involved in cell wall biosynthesis